MPGWKELKRFCERDGWERLKAKEGYKDILTYSPEAFIERRVDLACKIAKLQTGV